jgi:hypothetical protein
LINKKVSVEGRRKMEQIKVHKSQHLTSTLPTRWIVAFANRFRNSALVATFVMGLGFRPNLSHSDRHDELVPFVGLERP